MRVQPTDLPLRPSTKDKARDGPYHEFYHHSSAQRPNTAEVIAEAIRKQYPNLHLTLTTSCDLLRYAAAGHAQATAVDADGVKPENLRLRYYMAPLRRRDGDTGFLYDGVEFGKFLYKWRDEEYIVYAVAGQEGGMFTYTMFLLGTEESNDKLMLEAYKWQYDTHDTVLVFDGGYWQASTALWQSVQNASWDDVILDPEMKKSIIGEISKFYNSEERYKKLKVPWKRGIIYHGPPGNGKTISIKAMMHTLYTRPSPIPTLYVRSLSSYAGPEYSIKRIFSQARTQAPCFLVFEDLDSLVSPAIRSYFLNEVDGLQENDGILMVGSTNHLERLDPGISKRPSRFDRKYLFPDPGLGERIQYCEYWRQKLRDNEDVDFPEKLNKAIAIITKGFSFAYIQEAFVATLLAIANAGDDDDDDDDSSSSSFSKATNTTPSPSPSPTYCLGLERTPGPHPSPPLPYITEANPCPARYHVHCWDVIEAVDGDGWDEGLDQYILWREMKKVVKALREELNQGRGEGGRGDML